MAGVVSSSPAGTTSRRQRSPLPGTAPAAVLVAAVVAASALMPVSTAQAQAAASPEDGGNGSAQIRARQDPFEDFNRFIFEFNRKYAEPASGEVQDYVTAKVPGDVRQGVANVLSNLGEPITALSSLARGEFDNARVAAQRFMINSTLGWGGYFDRAGEMGVVSERKDLGQVMCTMGVPDGPYLVLPLYGPATVSDVMGSIVPMLAGYLTFGNLYWTWRAGYRVATVLEGDDPGKAADDYHSQRSSYLRYRDSACRSDHTAAAAEAPAETAAALPASIQVAN